MLQLVNIGVSGLNFAFFDRDWEKVRAFVREHGLDGIELMLDGRGGLGGVDAPPRGLVRGVHFPIWMGWLPLWRGDWSEVVRLCGSEEDAITYFGGRTANALLVAYRRGVGVAHELGASYAVLHAEHVDLEEGFTFSFKSSNEEVLTAVADLANVALGGADSSLAACFENTWWPGLSLRDPGQAERFLASIRHPNKGFVLDTGHLVNCNPELASEEDAVRFVEETVCSLGELVENVRVVHLQKSLSGRFMREPHLAGLDALRRASGFREKYLVVRNHALRMDEHKAFVNVPLAPLLRRIAPEFVTCELLAESRDDLGDSLRRQVACVSREV